MKIRLDELRRIIRETLEDVPAKWDELRGGLGSHGALEAGSEAAGHLDSKCE